VADITSALTQGGSIPVHETSFGGEGRETRTCCGVGRRPRTTEIQFLADHLLDVGPAAGSKRRHRLARLGHAGIQAAGEAACPAAQSPPASSQPPAISPNMNERPHRSILPRARSIMRQGGGGKCDDTH